MSGNWWIAAGLALVIGVMAAPMLIAYGLRQLATPIQVQHRLIILGAAVGTIAAAVAVAAAQHAGYMWWLPALLAWTLTLGAAATCDARARRIPTPLLVRGGAVIAPLLLVAPVATGDWRALIVTAAAVLTSGAVIGLCWRFAGVGFGDVRLAVVGGLGLGHVTAVSLTLGVVVFAGLSAIQAICTYWRTRNRKAHFVLAPALVLGFLAAAAF